CLASTACGLLASLLLCSCSPMQLLTLLLRAFVYLTVAWPSGLRRWIKAPVSLEAWVQIPPLPLSSDTGGPRPNSSGLLSQCERPYLHVLLVLEFLACTALNRSNLAMLWDTAVSFTSREVFPFS